MLLRPFLRSMMAFAALPVRLPFVQNQRLGIRFYSLAILH
jgi:hypothetical protein